MFARVFHSISITAVLSSSSSAVSLVRQSSLPQHALDDAATCFRRRCRARRCLNVWRNRSAKNMYGYAAEEAFGENTVGIEFLSTVEFNALQFRIVF
ncbi:uncharacterized protein DS421_20g686820 [Arachis hypogaea]|nr:uncharacterized protein DS421_20g686820 [Arachis hypogaea]